MAPLCVRAAPSSCQARLLSLVVGRARIGDVSWVRMGWPHLKAVLHHPKPAEAAQRVEGEVESIGYAINPPDVATIEGTNGLVPQVEPSFDWIRLAQRVPVRIALGAIPDGVQLVSGTTASVAIEPED